MEDGIMKKSLYITAALLTLAACSREMNIDTPAGDMTITARTETSAETKTIVEGQTHVYWEPGDEIKVFAGEKSGMFTTDITTSSATADFNGTMGDDAWTEGMDLWAVYPYSKDAVFSDGTITTVLPSEQVARAGSFGKDMNLAIAHSTTSDLQFSNVGGGFRFTLADEGIREVVFEGLDGEALAGKVDIVLRLNGPAIQNVSKEKSSITLIPSEGETFLKEEWYYIVAIPGTLEKGFKLTFRKDGTQECRVFGKAVTIKRGIFGSITHADKEPASSNETIDMGLPSGIKWASCNLGATHPEDCGDYYAWGETEPYYSRLDPVAWKSGKDDGYAWPSYRWGKGENMLTKYCPNPAFGYNGFVDDKTLLDPDDDVANVQLGDKWRTPTVEEFKELVDNCSWTWGDHNGVNGSWFTSKINGNSLFFPAVGGFRGTEILGEGLCGGYWSSSFDNDHPNKAWGMAFNYLNTVGAGWGADPRCWGYSIRPVYGDRLIPVESISLNRTEIEIDVDEPVSLSVTILPENATFKTVCWSSSDESVATVSSTGVITGIASGSAIITAATLTGDKTATCHVTVKEIIPSVPVPEAVDLGLSVKWASFNLGASKPEEYGDYYAWGVIETYYSNLGPLTWKQGFDKGYSWSDYKWCKESYISLTKYCTDDYFGYSHFTDGRTVLEPEDDAAQVVLGDGWRMPTLAEFSELYHQCSREWISVNGVEGYSFTGPNGSSIFLPAAGCISGKIYYDSYGEGDYWTSSLKEDHPCDAYDFYFYVDEIKWDCSDYRNDGRSIRPVKE